MIISLDLDIPHGTIVEPLFKSEEEEQRFRDWYAESVREELERLRLARLGSIHESMTRVVY